MAAPAVSVLIIAHNRAHTIGPAVRSVLGQTLSDLELVVVDDGSTDGTAEVVQGFGDPRLRLTGSRQNEGIPAARNRALSEARGRYIAWLDSDDLCHPERLAAQLQFLNTHPQIAMVGSAARKITLDNRLLAGGRASFREHDQIRALLLFRSPFQQSSIFGRAEAMREIPYDPAFPVCEDVDMFARLAERHRTANLPLFLIARRIHPGQTIRHNLDLIIDRQMAITARLLSSLEFNFTTEDLRNHVLLGGARGSFSDAVIDWAEGWSARMIEANRRRPIYDEAALRASFHLVVIKAALRRVRSQPSQARRLFALAQEFSAKAAATSLLQFGQTLLPFASRPSAAGFRPLLKA